MTKKLFYFLKLNIVREINITKRFFLIFIITAAITFTSSIIINKNINNIHAAIVSAVMPEPNVEAIAVNPPETPDKRFEYLGWWGDINYNKTGIYKEPTRASEYLGTFTEINRVKVLEEVKGEMVGDIDSWYKIDGGMYPGAYVFSHDVTPVLEPAPPAKPKIPAMVKNGEYWIDVDLTKKILSLFLYDKPVFATYVAIGVPSNPTLSGVYKIWYKIEKTRMRGRPPTAARVYDLPNVPYVMYYRGSYSIHGTYWHDKFGTRQSSGCTNLTQGDAKFIFEKVNPKIEPPTALYVFSNKENSGTVVYNHY